MNTIDIILIAFALSMDAFAVSVCKGLGMKTLKYAQAFAIALFFGVFQAIMPLLGWITSLRFGKYIANINHYIAFGILVFIGGRMLYGAMHTKLHSQTSFNHADKLNLQELFFLAIATSIDALAVGITFVLLPPTKILTAALVIGAITFIFSFAGVFIGNKFGLKNKNHAEIAGGLILIAIGIKILVEGLF